MGDFEEITGWEVLVIINSFAVPGALLLLRGFAASTPFRACTGRASRWRGEREGERDWRGDGRE